MKGPFLPIVVAALALAGLPSAAFAQGSPAKSPMTGPPAKISVSADGATIFVVGRITENTFSEFLDVTRAAPKAKTVSLASAGGELMGGYVMGNLVRLLKLNTHVDYSCLSACTLVFGAGVERTLGPDGQLGYHQSYRILPSGASEAAADFTNEATFAKLIAGDKRFTFGGGSDSLTVHAMGKLGVSQDFLRKVLQTPPEAMWFPDNARLIAENIVTRVLAPGEPAPPPPPGLRTREEFAAGLQQRPYWRALAKAEPALFEELLLQLWRMENIAADTRIEEARARDRADERLAPRRATSSDEALDRFAQYIGAWSRMAEKYGFPYCNTPIVQPPGFEDEAISLRAAADDVFAALYDSLGQVAPLDEGKARGIMIRNSGRLIAAGSPVGPRPADPVAGCRADERAVQAIAALEPKYRAQVLRASITLTTIADAKDRAAKSKP